MKSVNTTCSKDVSSCCQCKCHSLSRFVSGRLNSIKPWLFCSKLLFPACGSLCNAPCPMLCSEQATFLPGSWPSVYHISEAGILYIPHILLSLEWRLNDGAQLHLCPLFLIQSSASNFARAWNFGSCRGGGALVLTHRMKNSYFGEQVNVLCKNWRHDLSVKSLVQFLTDN
jgi:hypothetical protein